MDEVKAMTKAGENMGKAVGTGIRSARHGAVRAGELTKQAAVRADKELASRGIDTDELQERLAQRATGMSRKQLRKRAKKARKEWDKRTAQSRKQWAAQASAAGKELAARIEPPRRRRWPWVLLALAALGAVAAVALTRRPEELPIADADDYPRPPRHRLDESPDDATSPDGHSTSRSPSYPES